MSKERFIKHLQTGHERVEMRAQRVTTPGMCPLLWFFLILQSDVHHIQAGVKCNNNLSCFSD